MHRELRISTDPLDSGTGAAALSSTAGAVLVFLGVVRESEDGVAIDGIDYEAFIPMAEHQFSKLFDEMERRWPVLESVRLHHRIGAVAAGEPSLRVEVAAPHRAEAFAACQWLIDEMKRVVPIWKRPLRPTTPIAPHAPKVSEGRNG